jgi:hypothetical protein
VKIAPGRVVRGAVALVEPDKRTPIGLDPDDEAAILKGITQIEAGRGIPAARLQAKLRRR